MSCHERSLLPQSATVDAGYRPEYGCKAGIIKGPWITNIKSYTGNSCEPVSRHFPAPGDSGGLAKQSRAFHTQSTDLSTPPVHIPFRGECFEVRNLNGVRIVLRKGKRQHCWHLASPQLAVAVTSAYDAGLSVQAVRS